MAEDPEVELVLQARQAMIADDFDVRRAIPQVRRRMVGPFIFVDQMGPATLEANREITVLPHPHIGLSTVTFLFEGEGTHRDSLGTEQRILPGEVNWMTAGSGIVHSERLRAASSGRVFGVQVWVALPQELEESKPSFEHYGSESVPLVEGHGTRLRVIAGALNGNQSHVKVSSPLFYAELCMDAGATFILPAEYTERAVFVVEGTVTLAQTPLESGELACVRSGAAPVLRANAACRVLLLGGEPLDGPRHIRWNFVSSSKKRLEQAARDWKEQRFPRVPGETAYIPLPEDGDAPVNYP